MSTLQAISIKKLRLNGKSQGDVPGLDCSYNCFDGFYLDDVLPAGHLNQSINCNASIYLVGGDRQIKAMPELNFAEQPG